MDVVDLVLFIGLITASSANPTRDRCIVLIGGYPLNSQKSVEYYHPSDEVDCHHATIGRMSTDKADKTVLTSGCYLSDTHQLVVREAAHAIDGQKPSMLYDLNDGSAMELALPRKDGRYLDLTTTTAIGASKCLSCGGNFIRGKLPNRFEKFHSDCYQYDAGRSSLGWQRMPPMPTAFEHAAFVALDDRFVYIIGGWNKTNGIEAAIRTMYRYDTRLGRWSEETPMAKTRSDHAAVRLSSTELLVCGGHPLRRDCQTYSSRYRAWADAGSLQTGREDFALVNLNGVIYALGGQSSRDQKSAGNSVERYNRTTDRWEWAKPMKHPRSYFVAAVVGDKIFGPTLSPF